MQKERKRNEKGKEGREDGKERKGRKKEKVRKGRKKENKWVEVLRYKVNLCVKWGKV